MYLTHYTPCGWWSPLETYMYPGMTRSSSPASSLLISIGHGTFLYIVWNFFLEPYVRNTNTASDFSVYLMLSCLPSNLSMWGHSPKSCSSTTTLLDWVDDSVAWFHSVFQYMIFIGMPMLASATLIIKLYQPKSTTSFTLSHSCHQLWRLFSNPPPPENTYSRCYSVVHWCP